MGRLLCHRQRAFADPLFTKGRLRAAIQAAPTGRPEAAEPHSAQFIMKGIHPCFK